MCYPHEAKKIEKEVTSTETIEKDKNYASLSFVLIEAYAQASTGKGKERHANGLPFEQQPIMEIGRMVGPGYALGQAMKKAQESITLLKIKGKDAAKNEVLGAINYLAAAYILYDEERE